MVINGRRPSPLKAIFRFSLVLCVAGEGQTIDRSRVDMACDLEEEVGIYRLAWVGWRDRDRTVGFSESAVGFGLDDGLFGTVERSCFSVSKLRGGYDNRMG